jgi:hypothetical protein
MTGFQSKKAMANSRSGEMNNKIETLANGDFRVVPLDDVEFLEFNAKRNGMDIVMDNGMKKAIRDGRVAVLYSPGFGAGWSTWNSIREGGDALLFDPSIVYMVEEMNKLDSEDSRRMDWVNNIMDYCRKTYPECYCGGVDDLVVEWIPQGTMFKIHEYDGSENIEYKENDYWKVA